MIIDLKENIEIKDIQADICIIGAGAAGLTLAREFEKENYSVTILESGVHSYNKEIQNLYKGQFKYHGLGRENDTNHVLDRDRIRCLGGTTYHWGGMCATFDELDFQKRPWVPNSGWPISRDDLMPYYDRASKYLKLPKYRFPVIPKENPGRLPLKFDSNYDITTKMFYFSKIKNMGWAWSEGIQNSKNLTLYTNATVQNLDLDKKLGSLSSVTVLRNSKTLPSITVKAKKYVLATGAIENARILLSSNDVNKAGVGNDNDLVGRYFQAHGYLIRSTQIITLSPSTKISSLYARNPFGVLALSPKLQTKHQILNMWVGIGRFGGKIKPSPKNMLGDVQNEYDLLSSDLGQKKNEGKWYQGANQVFFEQEPDPNNRVTLSEELDWLGTPKSNVSVQISELQKHTLVESMKVIGHAIGQSFSGKVRIDEDNDRIFNSLDDGLSKHHHGTTRMDDDAKHGVVDSNCLTHSVKNLYVAGASVFPTSSATNPTYTIVAMSIRLADHLKSILKG
ncbi:MAG: GMC family oxidoreductase [SAR324 cluster bacterium]|nr:GMC family oxidoreductase [SAR324 cluster bacterium]